MSKLHPDLIEELVKSHSELKDLTVVLSSQTYGHVDPICVQKIRQSVMYASNHGLTWMGDVSGDRMPYSAARNQACEQLVEQCPEVDGIMWIDSDIQPRPEDITRLLFDAVRCDFDFVTGIYHQRDGDFQPCIYDWVQGRTLLGRYRKKGFVICDGYPANVIEKVAGCGFGFCYTSKKLVQAIKDSKYWKKEEGQWFPDKRDIGGFGEDLSFCWAAAQLGYQLWVDTSVLVGHTGGSQVVTQETFANHVKAKMAEDGKKLPKPV